MEVKQTFTLSGASHTFLVFLWIPGYLYIIASIPKLIPELAWEWVPLIIICQVSRYLLVNLIWNECDRDIDDGYRKCKLGIAIVCSIWRGQEMDAKI